MGNYRFRLSDLMPNSWFYKLRDMTKTRSQNISHPKKNKHPPIATQPPSTPRKDPQLSHPRQSYYFTTQPNSDQFYNSPINFKASDTYFHDPPRNSRRKTKRKNHRSSSKLVTSSVSSGCSCGTTFDYSATDIIIEMDNKESYIQKINKPDGFDSISELELPPILTKPTKFSDPIRDQIQKKETEHTKFRGSAKLEEKIRHSARKSISQSSQGLRIRTNSPRLASRKLQATNRKNTSTMGSRRNSVSESFAIMKSSFDPQRDFRESMVEMIVENNIRASKDLEELLACYLSLNSDVYHDVIIKVFKQIWFDLTDIQM
ncbi:ovate family protein 1 [Tasmannia lanceolata]|uniref:ovate family protein 1 n=1 Tax=Tasmannia lanceolata TaxID=3420 RepID=UPI00406448EC